jgi:hypothetical protein
MVDHSLTTSVARAGIALQIEAVITKDAAPKRSHLTVVGMRPSCSLIQF